MASKIVINLDTSKENYILAKCKQNDDLTLEASIFENGLEKDLTNAAITIQALKADNTYIIQNTNITKENNKIIADLDRDFTRAAGKTEIEILLVESSKQNTTFSFCLEVVGSVIKGAVQSSNTVTILEELEEKIVEAGQVRDETEQLIQSGGAATTGDIQEINSQLEHIKKKTKELNILDYKTENNTWQQAFDEVFNYITTNNLSGVVRVPKGIYYVTKLNIPTKTSIIGDSSLDTIFRSTGNNTNDYLIVANKNHGELKNFKIDGQNMVGGLFLTDTPLEKIVDNIHIVSCKGNSLYIGYPGYNNKLSNIMIYDNDGDGIVIDGTDNFLSTCIVKRITGNGFVINRSNNLFERCKTYYTGVDGDLTKGDGFVLQGGVANTNRFIDCEAQEVGRYCLNLDGANGNQFIGFNLDGPGMFSDINIALKMNNSNHNIINGVVANKTYLAPRAYTKQIFDINNSYFNNIELKKFELGGTTKPFLSDGTINNANGTNLIKINNFDEGIFNIFPYDKRLFKNVDGVAEGFTTTASSVSAYEFYTSYTHKCQAIKLINCTSGKNANINTTLPVNHLFNTKFGFRVDHRKSSSTVKFLVQVRFLDVDQEQIGNIINFNESDTSINKFTTLYNDSVEIPNGAKFVKIGLCNSALKDLINSDATVYIKNFECYLN